MLRAVWVASLSPNIAHLHPGQAKYISFCRPPSRAEADRWLEARRLERHHREAPSAARPGSSPQGAQPGFVMDANTGQLVLPMPQGGTQVRCVYNGHPPFPQIVLADPHVGAAGMEHCGLPTFC